jgi:hypothetical protein
MKRHFSALGVQAAPIALFSWQVLTAEATWWAMSYPPLKGADACPLPLHSNSFWGEPIHVCTCAQAISDGLLVDLTTATHDKGQLLCREAWPHENDARAPASDKPHVPVDE